MIVMFSTANFVLPLSKDMHGSDEYFDQVITYKLDCLCIYLFFELVFAK